MSILNKKISIIVAVGKNNEIGYKNDLLWHISDDLKRFKKITTNHTILMGRKTYESLRIKPLPNRTNIVLTKSKVAYEGCKVVNSLLDAISLFDNEKENFIIGGGEIYKLFLPIASKLYITSINSTFEADVFFPKIDFSEWNETEKINHFDDKNNFEYSYITLARKKS